MSETLPESATIVGTIHITHYIDEDGEFATGFDVEGVSDEAALGFMVTVSDRIRETVKYKWETCPECSRPWSEHFDDEDKEEDEDELQS